MKKDEIGMLVIGLILANISAILFGLAFTWGTKEWLMAIGWETGILSFIDIVALCFIAGNRRT